MKNYVRSCRIRDKYLQLAIIILIYKKVKEVVIMVTGLLHLSAILKDIEIKRQELNSMVYNIADYHSGVILGKSQELDKLIVEFYEKKQR